MDNVLLKTKSMKKALLITCFSLLSLVTYAQYGLSAGYVSNQNVAWRYYFTDDVMDSGFQVGVNYWFRLKNYRVEFTPELAYSRFKSELNDPSVDPGYEMSMNMFHFFFNTNLYVLDFKGDCDCPTFSKEGTFVNKGLFLFVSPGISYFDGQMTGQTNSDMQDAVLSLGVGAGVDIGLNDVVTVTPMFSFRRFFRAEWEGLAELAMEEEPTRLNSASETTDINQWFLGLKMTVRLDEINKYGYR